MEKFLAGCILGFTIGFVFGIWQADEFALEWVKDYTGYTWSELDSLKSECEVSLPRDKFCKLEIKAVGN